MGKFYKINFYTMIFYVHLFYKKKFFIRTKDNRVFSYALFLLLNKKMYTFRNKYNLFFEKLNIFQNYYAKYNLLYVNNKIEYLMYKICFKIKRCIKKLIEYYQEYLIFFFDKNLKIKKYIFNSKPDCISFFNLELKYIRKGWYNKFNEIHNPLFTKFKKKKLIYLIEKFILAENIFLTVKHSSLNIVLEENKFFKDFFFSAYKINSKLNSTLNFFRKKKTYSKLLSKKKPVLFIHQKILGFFSKITFRENIKKMPIFSGKIFKKFTE
nr:hypothetical protein Cry52Nrm2_p046 [Cryptomonas curvata]